MNNEFENDSEKYLIFLKGYKLGCIETMDQFVSYFREITKMTEVAYDQKIKLLEEIRKNGNA